ncbi:MAG: branched-chain amino acid ABC transporter permease [Acidimicrobiaceae bacterium]|nr:branched-chain amino acid ABC transporter permease [Acidimicrobiaceae bacterium]
MSTEMRVHLRRWLSFFAMAALIAIMTGPSGSNNAPVQGLTQSFAQPYSYFGLFRAQRWMIFFTFALVALGLQTLWRRSGGGVRARTAVLRQGFEAPGRRRATVLSAVVVVALVALFIPHLISNPGIQSGIVEQVLAYVILALGLNVVVGWAGLLDLGYVGFYAIGAYVTAWMTGRLPIAAPFHHPVSSFAAIPVAIVFTMLAGVILGAPTLRLRGDYLAIVTLGFGEIILVFSNNLTNVTGGSQGTNPYIPSFTFRIGGLKYLFGNVGYYFLVAGFVVVTIVLFRLLEHSRVGRAWTAIREDEVAAESIGINPLKYKVMAFAIGASVSGFAGAVTASQIGVVYPSTFSLYFSVNVLTLVIFGGMGSIVGVIFGSILVQGIAVYLRFYPPSGYQASDLYMYLGALLIMMMIYRPAGLIPSRRRRREIYQAEDGIGHEGDVLLGEQS